MDEGLKNHVASISFFIGITYRQMALYDDAIIAYQHAIQLNPYYSDSYFNLANIFFEEKKDFSKAESYYKKALEVLDEANKIQQFANLEDESPTKKLQNSTNKLYEGA